MHSRTAVGPDGSGTQPEQGCQQQVFSLDSLPECRAAEFHLFRAGGRDLLFNVETLLSYEAEECAAALLRAVAGRNPQGIQSLVARFGRKKVNQSLQALAAGQFILARKAQPVSNLREKVDTRSAIASVNFNVTHACNLACRYCYGAHGSHPARTAAPGQLLSMDDGTARRSIVWALREMGADGEEFGFGCFGGEPLANFRLIRSMKDWLDEAGERFGRKLKLSIFTNAVLLDEEVLDFIVANGIGVIVSIDGPPEVHDRNRPHVNGGGSAADVVRNVRRLLERRPGALTARGTFARWNMLEGRHLVDIVRYLLDLGFNNAWLDCISERGAAGSFLPEDVPRLRELYEEAAAEILRCAEQGRSFDFSNITRYVASLRLVEDKKVSWGCGAGRGFACLAPDGGIYVCHRFTGMQDWRLGDVFGGVSKRLTHEIISRQNVQLMNGCRTCWMRYLCGGGCLKIHLEGTGSPFLAYEDVYCNLRRIEAEMGLYINSELKRLGAVAQRTMYGDQLMAKLAASGEVVDPCRWS